VDEPERLAARSHVGPLVATVEVELHSEDAQRQVVLEDLVVGLGHLEAAGVTNEDDVVHRETDVSHAAAHRPVEGTAGEARSLDIRALTDHGSGVPGALGAQFVEQDLKEVVIDLRGVGHADLIQLQVPGPPQRHLLQTDEVRRSSLDLVREKPGADEKVGLVHDGAGDLGAVRERDEDLRHLPTLGLGGKCGADRPVDIGAEIHVARHDRDRLAGCARRRRLAAWLSRRSRLGGGGRHDHEGGDGQSNEALEPGLHRHDGDSLVGVLAIMADSSR
jgi:hypothetical protein